MTKIDLFLEISQERERQDEKWGSLHDDMHEWQVWSTLVDERIANPTRKNLIQAAALIVAWIESNDRKEVISMGEN